MIPPQGTILGREQELAAVSDVLTALTAGVSGRVVVEGEAGIGKTTMLGAVLEEARSRGIRVLHAAAEELDRGRPYGPIRDALASARGDLTEVGLQWILDGKGADVNDGGPPQDKDFLAVEAVLETIETLGRAPLVLAIEDIHWADGATLHALASVVSRLRDMPIVVVITARPLPRHSEVGALLERLDQAGAITLSLTPLAPENVVEIARRSTGGEPGPRLVSLLERAGGNPLFVVELLVALGEEGALHVTNGVVDTEIGELPDNLRLTLVRRLRYLDANTVDLLRVASALGMTFAPGDLALVKGISPADLVGPLDTARRAGLLEDRGERLRFRHELVRQVLYEGITPSVRRVLHRDIAAALSRGTARLEAVAEHVSLGAVTGDVAAIEWLTAAAKEVAGRSTRVAVQLLERALELAANDPELGDPVAARLGLLLVALGRGADAIALIRPILTRQAHPKAEVGLHLALATAEGRAGRVRAALTEFDRASELLPEPIEVIVRSGALLFRVLVGDVESARDEAERILRAADEHALAYPAVNALGVKAYVHLADGRVAEAVSLAERAVRISRDERSQGSGFLLPQLHLGHALVEADRIPEAYLVLADARQRIERYGTTDFLSDVYVISTFALYCAGEWDDALAESETALALSDDGRGKWDYWFHAVTARILLARGEGSLARRAVEAAEAAKLRSDFMLHAEWVGGARGLLLEHDGAGTAGYEAVARAWLDSGSFRRLSGYAHVAPDVVRLGVAAGDHTLPEAVVTEVEDLASRARTRTARAVASLCRGLLDGDRALLATAAEQYRDGPRPYLAQMLSAAAAGTSWQPSRADHRSRSRPTKGWGALTPTERRVAALVAEGLTNPRIADALHISRHTVETHLKNIYGKLALNSKVQLALEATRHSRAPG